MHMHLSKLIFIATLATLVPLFSAHAATVKSVSNTGLVGYWSFNEGTSTIAHDFSGNKNNGTLTAAVAALPIWTSGKLGRALNFDGASGYVSVPNGGPLNNLQSGSISLWVKYNNTTQPNVVNLVYGTLLVRQHDGVFTNQWLGLDGSDPATAHIRWCPYTATVAGCAAGSTVIGANTWNNITVVYTSGSHSVYVNGALDIATTTAGSMGNDSTPLDIGGMFSTSFKNGIIGAIDDVRVYNRQLSASEAQTIYQNGLQNGFTKVNAPFNFITNGLVSDWTFNGNDMNWATGLALDRLGGNNGSLISFSTTTSPVAGKLGQGLKFDANASYVNAPAVNGGNNFSLCSWVYLRDTSTVASIITKQYNGVGGTVLNYALGFGLNTGIANQLQFGFFNGGTWHLVTESGSFPTKQWKHVCGTWDGTTASLYINGALDNSATPGGTASNDTNPTWIGRRHDSFYGTPYLSGSLDDVRIYNRALSVAEVKQVYSYGAATVSASTNTRSASGLIGLWSFDGKDMSWAANQALDRSGNGNNGILTNMGTTTSPAPGKIGQALKFNGSGTQTYVNVTSNAPLTIAAGDSVTMCAWIYDNTGAVASPTFQSIMAKRNDNLGTPYAYGMNFVTNSFQVYTSGASGIQAFTYTVPAKQWIHICGVISSTSATALYVNGALFGTKGTGGGVASNTANFHIGASSPENGAFETFNGKIDDVRLYSRALSADEVAQLYNQGK